VVIDVVADVDCEVVSDDVAELDIVEVCVDVGDV
jgi:hypothetical protein